MTQFKISPPDSYYDGRRDSMNYARKIIVHEWQKLAQQLTGLPGSTAETFVNRLVDRIDDVRARAGLLPDIKDDAETRPTNIGECQPPEILSASSFVKSILDADKLPPEASHDNVEDMLAHLNDTAPTRPSESGEKKCSEDDATRIDGSEPDVSANAKLGI